MARHRRIIGICWALVSGAALLLYACATKRATGDDLHVLTAAALAIAGAVQVATPLVKRLQTGMPAAYRSALVVTALVLRATVLIWVGSARSDRTAELLGAGLALCWASAIVLFRLMIEIMNADSR